MHLCVSHTCRYFKSLLVAKEEGRDLDFSELDRLITFANIANDECDYGQALKLGLDMFTMVELDGDTQNLLAPTYRSNLTPSRVACLFDSKLLHSHVRCARTLWCCLVFGGQHAFLVLISSDFIRILCAAHPIRSRLSPHSPNARSHPRQQTAWKRSICRVDRAAHS